MEEIYSLTRLPSMASLVPATFLERSIPCFTASSTVFTLAFGSCFGFVFGWYTPVETNMEYQSSSTSLSNSFVPWMSYRKLVSLVRITMLEAHLIPEYRQQNKSFAGHLLYQTCSSSTPPKFLKHIEKSPFVAFQNSQP